MDCIENGIILHIDLDAVACSPSIPLWPVGRRVSSTVGSRACTSKMANMSYPNLMRALVNLKHLPGAEACFKE